jgi:predicted permease
LRKALVVAQVALSLLLLIGSGLFIRSLTNLKDINPGFHSENLVAVGVDPTMNGYKPERSLEFYRQLSQRMKELPGVRAASFAVVPLLDNNEWDSSVTVDGYTAKLGEAVDPHMEYVAPGFFDTMRIGLRGRDFTDRDRKDSPLVAIVNERFAKKYFGGSNPIGRRIGMGMNPGTKTDIEIVGVAQDTRYENLRTEIPYEVYCPYLQMILPQSMTAYIRAEADPENLFSSMRRAVHEIDSNVPVYRMRTMTEQVDGSLMSERLLAALSTAFGLLATLLAAIGLYGVMAYMVTQRTREIGIRVALGAKGGNIAGLVMREVMLLAAAGIGVGLPAAAALTRLAKALFYGVTPNDPLTVILAAVSVAATAFAAGYLPSRRAARVDPMRALRWE